jgi:acetyl-CoA carboxylase alpha subunit
MIRGHAPDQRRIVRQDQSKPVVDDLRAWLDVQLAKVPRRARIAEAIRYLNRKNALFAGSDQGGASAAAPAPRSGAVVLARASAP